MKARKDGRTHRVSLWLSDKEWESLDQLAQERGQTKPRIIRELILNAAGKPYQAWETNTIQGRPRKTKESKQWEAMKAIPKIEPEDPDFLLGMRGLGILVPIRKDIPYTFLDLTFDEEEGWFLTAGGFARDRTLVIYRIWTQKFFDYLSNPPKAGVSVWSGKTAPSG